MLTTSLTLAFEPMVDRRVHGLDLSADFTLANFYSVALWGAVAVFAWRLACRRRRPGWLSVAVLGSLVAVGEVNDV